MSGRREQRLAGRSRLQSANAAIEAKAPGEPWFHVRRPEPRRRWRLFCFPYAGGTASSYQGWPGKLPADVEVCAVELPGRRRRFREPAFAQLEPLMEALLTAVAPHVDGRTAFFGHSLGAAIAYELACRLRAHGLRLGHLFVSGMAAPGSPTRREPIHGKPDEAFLVGLRELGGTPPELLRERELMQTLLPTLRADFTLAETYRQRGRPPLDIDLTVFGGDADPFVPVEDLEGWGQYSGACFQKHVLNGDHFFITSAQEVLLKLVAEGLRESETPRSAGW